MPSGWGSRPLLGITPEAPAVAAKFPEETRLPGRCSGKASCAGRGSGRGAGARGAGAALHASGRIAPPESVRCGGRHAAFRVRGVKGSGVDSPTRVVLAPPRGGAGFAARGSAPWSGGWKGRGLACSPEPSSGCTRGMAAGPVGGAGLSRSVPSPAPHPGKGG